MDSAVAVPLTILALCTQLVWKTYSATPKYSLNVLFMTIFPDLNTVTDLLATLSLSFAPGLLEVLQSATPPTIAYFKTLPDPYLADTWAVYVLVLEKNGRRPKVYIGSGTDRNRSGVRARMRRYDKLDFNAMPEYVKRALDDGFEITHKGLLCWISLPPIIMQPLYRLPILALESTFSRAFWAMFVQTDFGYGMSDLCPWTRFGLAYDGLCTHSALGEGRGLNIDITEEEAAAIQEEIRERRNRLQRQNRSRRNARDTEGYLAKNAAAQRRKRLPTVEQLIQKATTTVSRSSPKHGGRRIPSVHRSIL